MKDGTMSEEKTQSAFGKRIYAGIIDLIIWIILSIIAGVTFGNTTTAVHGSSKSVNVSLTGWPACIFFLVALAYFVILEWRFGGSVGKLVLGIRVANDKGGPVTLKQSAIRNILRVVDAFPYVVPYLTGLILIAGDGRKRRLGDRAANTLVIIKSNQDNSNRWSLP